MTGSVLELTDVSKDYHALRPLRIKSLRVSAAEHVALLGFDHVSAEVFVNLVTGVTLPDRGAISLLGRSTADITDANEWLSVVDRVGIVSKRAVLLEALTVIQNLAMPYTLDIEPPPPDVKARASDLAFDVGLAESTFDRPIAELAPSDVFRTRMARALALDPSILLLEHPTAELSRSDIPVLAQQCRAVASRRHIAVLALTADAEFAGLLASRVLRWQPASGQLTADGWLSRFRRA